MLEVFLPSVDDTESHKQKNVLRHQLTMEITVGNTSPDMFF